MGYCAGETPLSYPETDYQMVLQLISSAKRLVDYVILDCGSAMTNVFTPAAIESGEHGFAAARAAPDRDYFGHGNHSSFLPAVRSCCPDYFLNHSIRLW